MTGSRQTARSQSAHEQIVQAALTVFALKGYAVASMDDVCLAAGMSKGGVYHHFATKRAVLVAVVERLIRDGALLPSANLDARASVATPAVTRILIEVWAAASRDDALRQQVQDGYASYVDESAAGEGAWALPDILQIGTLIQLLTRGVALDAEEAARRLGIEQAA